VARSAKKRVRWIRQRDIVAAEAVLLIGVLKDVVMDRVRVSHFPNWGKVVFLMAVTLGMLGGLFLLLERWLARGVSRTTGLAHVLPVPAAVWVIHALVMVALFFAYANLLGVRVL
jgi:Zn-dependent protease